MGNNVYVSGLQLVINGVTEDINLTTHTKKKLAENEDRIELIRNTIESALN